MILVIALALCKVRGALFDRSPHKPPPSTLGFQGPLTFMSHICMHRRATAALCRSLHPSRPPVDAHAAWI